MGRRSVRQSKRPCLLGLCFVALLLSAAPAPAQQTPYWQEVANLVRAGDYASAYNATQERRCIQH